MRVEGRYHPISIVLGILLCISLITGCPVTGPLGDDNSGTSAISQNLMSMPEIVASFPASLAPEGATAKGAAIRAIGDVTPATATDLPDVRGGIWNTILDWASLDLFTKLFLEVLRDYGSEVDLLTDTVYPIGMRDVGPFTWDLGSFIITGTDSDFTVFWHIKPGYTEGEGPSLIWLRIRVERTGNEWVIRSDYVETEESASLPEDPYTMRLTEFNSAANTTTRVQGYFYMGSDYGRAAIFSFPNPDGSHIIAGKSDYGESFLLAGWGDDDMAGVALTSGNTYLETEYYTEAGALQQSALGRDDLSNWSGGLGAATMNGVNIAGANGIGGTAPSYVYTFEIDDAGAKSLYISADDTLDTGSDTDSGILSAKIAYFRPGASWASGDVIYDAVEVSATVDGAKSTIRKRYEPALTVPMAETHLGNSYYVFRTFPVKNLIPLAGGFSGLNVAQLHIGDGNGTVQYADGTFEEYTFPIYSYFIDYDADLSYDQSVDIDLARVEQGKYYAYDRDLYESIETVVPVLTPSTLTLPTHFTLPDQSLVSAVDVKMEEIMTDEVVTIDLSYEETRLVDLRGMSEFADLID